MNLKELLGHDADGDINDNCDHKIVYGMTIMRRIMALGSAITSGSVWWRVGYMKSQYFNLGAISLTSFLSPCPSLNPSLVC